MRFILLTFSRHGLIRHPVLFKPLYRIKSGNVSIDMYCLP